MNDVAISVKNLNKTFSIQEDKKSTLRALFSSFFTQGKTKKFKALENINFEIKRGEFVGIVGRNGSGKSTLLKILAGIYNPDKNSVLEINGTMVPFLELGVGFNPDLSGRENIYLNGAILGMTTNYIKQKFDEIVDFAELREFIEVPVKNYSSGMMVRLAFSIAIQSNADIYLLDEILAVGDENFQKKSANVIRRLKNEGKTILFISHSMETIKAYCDRALLVDKSELKMDGNPFLVTEEYKRLNEEAVGKTKKENTKNRWGNRDVEITKVVIRNEEGKETNEFEKEGKILLDIEYKTNRDLHSELMFGVSIYREDGIQIFGTHSKYFDIHPITKKNATVRFSISAEYLFDSDYSFTIALFDNKTKEVLDYHLNRFLFRIKIHNGRGGWGTASLPSSWEIIS